MALRGKGCGLLKAQIMSHVCMYRAGILFEPTEVGLVGKSDNKANLVKAELSNKS